jgi:hydrogenase/urease accessory protein HupE
VRGAWLLCVVGLLAAPFAAGIASAHDLGLARLDLLETEPGHYTLRALVTKPFDPQRLEPVLPDRCAVRGMHASARGANRVELRSEIACEGAPLSGGDEIALPWGRSGTLVSARWVDGSQARRFFQSANADTLAVPVRDLRASQRTPLEAGQRYLALGVEHILTGWDHLAFVLALCLLASGMGLVSLVTAFTVGHSISLSLAVLGFVALSTAAVEACIALSVAFLAREALLGRRGGSPWRYGAILVAGFGLLHGLGFASALTEAGIESSHLAIGLIGFNLGVEIGQLLFLALVAALAFALRSRGLAPLRSAAAYAVGILGLFWTLERLAGLAR